jgi:3-oxoacyl-[acyl-carrier protein] reductase
MTGTLKDRVAIVTGAGRGIGRAIAKRFAAEGSKVAIGTRTPAHGEATVADIRKEGGEATFIQADVGFRDQCVALVRETERIYGRVDILVHNAGEFPYATIDKLTEDTLDATIAVNLKACVWLTQAALPSLKRAADGGRILITSSVSGNHAYAAGLTHYSAAKAGVTGFIRNLALELAPARITVNAVEPGFIITERLQGPEMANFVDGAVASIPISRRGDPADIAYAMLFFASPEASYITGQSIIVDGGFTLTDGVDFGAPSAG